MTYKRTFKAKVVDGFYEALLRYVMVDEGLTFQQASKYYGGKDLHRFARSVGGKVVTLQENAYITDGVFHGIDCVKPSDNNWIIPAELYEEVTA